MPPIWIRGSNGRLNIGDEAISHGERMTSLSDRRATARRGSQPAPSNEAAPEALVPTVQVFDRILSSGLDPATAFERLAEEMVQAGYPKHYPALSPADAHTILAVILGSEAS